MSPLEINIELKKIDKKNCDRAIIEESLASRKTAHELLQESRNTDALERVISSLRTLRDFSDFDNVEFRALLMGLLFDLAEIHFALKDYKQSEKELEILFKVLDGLIKEDSDRFAKFHILAMELSTRILRSRKKAMDLLVKQQINTGVLYEKVNAGVAAATDKLVDSLRNAGQLLASAGGHQVLKETCRKSDAQRGEDDDRDGRDNDAHTPHASAREASSQRNPAPCHSSGDH